MRCLPSVNYSSIRGARCKLTYMKLNLNNNFCQIPKTKLP